MPSAAFNMTQRDREIVESLVHRVRVFSTKQIARAWWNDAPERDILRRLDALSEAGLVTVYRALAHPELPLTGPVASWSPGQEPPAFGELSYRLKARWSQPPISTQCVIATTLAGRSNGGFGGRFPRESEQTHDIHLAGVYLGIRSRRPEVIQFWRSEARILWERRGEKREKLPDAVLDLPTGPLVIEFGGAYSKPKLEAFHDYCDENATPYEIW